MKDGRQELILNLIEKQGRADLGELMEVTGASPATIRRDLSELEKKGFLQRCRGGASAPEKGRRMAGYVSLPDPFMTEKEVIARRAVEEIRTGDHVFVGAGMTGNLLCRFLRDTETENVTVVTSSVTAVLELASDPRFSIILLGGRIHAGSNHVETLDEFTVENLSQFYFNKAFFTVDGAELEYGYSIQNRSELILYRYILRHSEKVYLMLGSSKIRVKTFTRFARLEEIPHVISDEGLSEEYRRCYEESGVELILAGEQPGGKKE